MKKVLLHICCPVCALAVIEDLLENNFIVKGFFFNPNIHPYQEYEKRKKDLDVIRESYCIDIIQGRYDPGSWFDVCTKHAACPEGGERCRLCYEIRLKETFRLCRELDFDLFTTTLTISPHKKSEVIFKTAKNIGGAIFLEKDFKKNDGFKKTIEAAKSKGFYRQNYCGCEYSMVKSK